MSSRTSSDAPLWRSIWHELIARHAHDEPPSSPAQVLQIWEQRWPTVGPTMGASATDIDLAFRQSLVSSFASSANEPQEDDDASSIVLEPLANETAVTSDETIDQYIQINATQAWKATGDRSKPADPYDFYFDLNIVIPNVISLELIQFRLPARAYQTIGNIYGSNFLTLVGRQPWNQDLAIQVRIPTANYTVTELIDALNRSLVQSILIANTLVLRTPTAFSLDVSTQLTSLTLAMERHYGCAHFHFHWNEDTLPNYLGFLPALPFRFSLHEVVGEFMLPPETDSNNTDSRFRLQSAAQATLVCVWGTGASQIRQTLSLLDAGLRVGVDYHRAALFLAFANMVKVAAWLAPQSYFVLESHPTTNKRRVRLGLLPLDANVGVHGLVPKAWVVQFPDEAAASSPLWQGPNIAFGCSDAASFLTAGRWVAESTLKDATLVLPQAVTLRCAPTNAAYQRRDAYDFTLTLDAGRQFPNAAAFAGELQSSLRTFPALQQSTVAINATGLVFGIDLNVRFQLVWDNPDVLEDNACQVHARLLDNGAGFITAPFRARPTISTLDSTTVRLEGQLTLQGSGYELPANLGLVIHLKDRNVTAEVKRSAASSTYPTYLDLLAAMNDLLVTWTDIDNQQPFANSSVQVTQLANNQLTFQWTIRLTKVFTENDYMLQLGGLGASVWYTWFGFTSTTFVLQNNGAAAAVVQSPKAPDSYDGFHVTNDQYVWAQLETCHDAYSPGMVGRRRYFTLPVLANGAAYTASTLIRAFQDWLTADPITRACTIGIVTDPVTLQRRTLIDWTGIHAELSVQDFDLVLYDSTWIVSNADGTCNSELFRNAHLASPTTSLGWMLGYHLHTRYRLDQDATVVGDVALTTPTVRLTGNAGITTQSFQYAVMIVDDFVLNKQGTTIITAANPSNRRTPSAGEYVFNRRRICQATISAQLNQVNPLLYSAIPTRGQLLALGLERQAAADNQRAQFDESIDTIGMQRAMTIQNNNMIAMIPLNGDPAQPTLFNVSTAIAGTTAMFARKYFNPTSLSRFHIQLFTEYGTYLPLINNQWECLLKAVSRR